MTGRPDAISQSGMRRIAWNSDVISLQTLGA
jgi:hypothetical protein